MLTRQHDEAERAIPIPVLRISQFQPARSKLRSQLLRRAAILGRGRGYGRNTGGREGFCLCDSVTDRAEGGELGTDEGLLVEVGSRGIC